MKCSPDKGTKAVPAEAAAAAGPSPVKHLDNLFFIEEPKSVSVTESEYFLFVRSNALFLCFCFKKANIIIVCCLCFAEGTATFIAKVGGDPIPNVKWMKGKWRQITPGGRISVEHKGQEAKLEIREVTKSDSGQYRCVASNKHGEIECSTDMHVKEKKETAGVRRRPQSQTEEVGDHKQ